MRNWKELKTNYYGSKESGSKKLLPVRNYYVDVTTGELLSYEKVYMAVPKLYTIINHIIKYYDNVIYQGIERTIECKPRNPNGETSKS